MLLFSPLSTWPKGRGHPDRRSAFSNIRDIGRTLSAGEVEAAFLILVQKETE